MSTKRELITKLKELGYTPKSDSTIKELEDILAIESEKVKKGLKLKTKTKPFFSSPQASFEMIQAHMRMKTAKECGKYVEREEDILDELDSLEEGI